MQKFTIIKALPIFILFVLVVAQGQSFLASARLNAGYLQINRLIRQPEDLPEEMPQTFERFFKQATLTSNTSQAAWRGLGLVSVLQGDLEKAVHAWQEAQTPVSELVVFGKLKSREGKKDEGLFWLQVAAGIDLVTAATPLAEHLHEQKDYEGAIDIWQGALDTYPENQQRLTWWLGLSRSLRSNKEWREAAEVSKEALIEFPENPHLLTSHGSALLSLNIDYETVSTILQQAISLDKDYAEAYIVMARLMERENRYQEAFDYFDQAIMRDSSVKWWHVARANSTHRLGNIEEARTLLLETIDLFPNYAPAHYELAGIFKLVDDSVQAQIAIERALDLNNVPALNYYVRAGDIYAWSNEIDLAQSAYQRASELAQDDERIIQGLESLKRVP